MFYAVGRVGAIALWLAHQQQKRLLVTKAIFVSPGSFLYCTHGFTIKALFPLISPTAFSPLSLYCRPHQQSKNHKCFACKAFYKPNNLFRKRNIPSCKRYKADCNANNSDCKRNNGSCIANNRLCLSIFWSFCQKPSGEWHKFSKIDKSWREKTNNGKNLTKSWKNWQNLEKIDKKPWKTALQKLLQALQSLLFVNFFKFLSFSPNFLSFSVSCKRKPTKATPVNLP